MSTESFGLNNKKPVWIVSELFYPEMISTGYIITEIAKSLQENHEVSVISGPEFYEKAAEKKTVPPLENITTHRINFSGYNKNKFISRAIGHLKVTFLMLSLMLKKIPKNSEVLMVTNPILLTLLTSFFIKSKGWKVKLLVHDVFPENMVASGLLKSKKSIFFLVLKRVFNAAFKKVDTLIVLGRDMENLLKEKTKGKTRIKIIENWADTENIDSHTVKKPHKNFLFAGNLGRLQGIECLLEGIKRTNDKTVTFTFIGSGVLDEKIEVFVKDNPTINIKKYGWQPREKQNEFLSEATIGVVSLVENMYGLGVPSKSYNLMASGKPIFYIGDEGSEIHLLIKDYKFGWFAKSGDVEMIANTIDNIVNTEASVLDEYRANSRKLAEDLFNKKLILSKFNDLFKS